MTKLDNVEHGARRSALLRLSILSSGLSKVTGLGLQALAIPLVFHSLGQRDYELYLLMTGLLATISLTQMGAGPALTQGLAKANAAGNRKEEASILGATLRLTFILAMLGATVVTAIIHFCPPRFLFGASFAHDKVQILDIANVCIVVLMIQIASGVVDSALAGYQEQFYTNVGSLFANIGSIILIFLVCKFHATITDVVLVLYGVPTLSRITNLVGLFRRRKYLLSGLSTAGSGHYRRLLNVGSAFWLLALSGAIETQGGTFVLAHLSSTRETDYFSVVYKAIGIIGAVVAIFTSPLWPAFTDAIAHKDVKWIVRSYNRIRLFLTSYSVVVAIVMTFFGNVIFQRLMHIAPGGNKLLFPILGIYFVANIWTHLYYLSMLGMPNIWRVTAVALCERIVLIILGVSLVPHFGACGMAMAYLIASIAFPAWLLPRMMNSELEKIEGGTVNSLRTTAVVGGN